MLARDQHTNNHNAPSAQAMMSWKGQDSSGHLAEPLYREGSGTTPTSKTAGSELAQDYANIGRLHQCK